MILNTDIVAELVFKLSASHQDRWHQDKTSKDFRNDQRKPGEKFWAWLEIQGAAAVLAQLTHQALALSKQPLEVGDLVVGQHPKSSEWTLAGEVSTMTHGDRAYYAYYGGGDGCSQGLT